MSNDSELCKVQVLSTYTREGKSLLERRLKFSDWTRMVKSIARLKQRVKEAKGLESRSSETTSLVERRVAELFIIRLVQEAAFNNEILGLKKQKAYSIQDKAGKL